MSVPKGRAFTPEEKKQILNRILAVWVSVPDMRLGQLIVCSQYTVDTFYVEDQKLVENVEAFLSTYMKDR